MEWLTGFLTGILASFVFGSFWFWVLLITSWSFITGSVNRRSGGWAFFWTVLLGIVLAYNLKGANGKLIFAGILGYVAFGVFYSVIQWKKHVTSLVAEFKTEQEKNLRLIEDDKAPRDAVYERAERDYQYEWRVLQGATTASRNKSQLSLWVFYWPFSLVWKLSGGIVETVYDLAAGWYNDIQKKALADVPRHNA